VHFQVVFINYVKKMEKELLFFFRALSKSLFYSSPLIDV
jgi:hypothetical protein